MINQQNENYMWKAFNESDHQEIKTNISEQAKSIISKNFVDLTNQSKGEEILKATENTKKEIITYIRELLNNYSIFCKVTIVEKGGTDVNICMNKYKINEIRDFYIKINKEMNNFNCIVYLFLISS